MYSPDGLNPYKLMDHKRSTGSVVGFEGAKTITNEELLALKCDILIPAVENVSTSRNADEVEARVVVESANGPIAHKAARILRERKVLIVPDILAKGGGVTVSYLEWVQSLHREHWSLEDVNKRLKERMVRVF